MWVVPSVRKHGLVMGVVRVLRLVWIGRDRGYSAAGIVLTFDSNSIFTDYQAKSQLLTHIESLIRGISRTVDIRPYLIPGNSLHMWKDPVKRCSTHDRSQISYTVTTIRLLAMSTV